MKEEWLFPNAFVPVDVETTSALVVEIKRLIDVVGGMALAQPAQEPWCMKMNRCTTKCEDCPDEPAQEPVAWLDEEKKIIYWHNTHETDDYHGFRRTTPLYTTPQQRPWVGLTDEDQFNLVHAMNKNDWHAIQMMDAIEAKLKEKNT